MGEKRRAEARTRARFACPNKGRFSIGKDPVEAVPSTLILRSMNLILLIVVLLLLFGGGGYYYGGPAVGGGGLGLILVICLIIYLMGGFRSKN